MVVLLAGVAFQACNKGKTYAEYKEEEREAIQRFIEVNGIKVISMDEFLANDTATDVSKNEYVLFNDNGVYMQIDARGNGDLMANGRHEVLARYWEMKILETGQCDTLSTNVITNVYPHPDEFVVTKVGSRYSGTFVRGAMVDTYNSYSVPEGWLLPFDYLRTGRETKGRAKIKLIVPHTKGTSAASSYIYPSFYELTYQLSR